MVDHKMITVTVARTLIYGLSSEIRLVPLIEVVETWFKE